MMKRLFLFLILLLPLNLMAQDSILSRPQKSCFSIQAGAYYKTFLTGTYINPTSYREGDEFADHQYERFKKKPNFGFSAGLLYTYRFAKRWGFTTGLLYSLKREVYENNQDSVIKYGNASHLRDIHNVMTYDYTCHNLELPLMFQFRVKKITLFAGSYFTLLSYKISKYDYVVNQYPDTPQWITDHKTIRAFVAPLKVLPTFQLSYEINAKKVKLDPYIAFYYALNNQQDFYIQLGLNIPLVGKSAR